MANGELWHILAVGLPADFAPSHSPSFVPVKGQETGAEIAARAVAAGAFVAIAHPQWSGLVMEDARAITAAHAVEIYNHGCATGCDRADGFMVADQLLTEGRRLTLIATDDAHFSEPDHFGGWVMVKAEANEPEALLAALKAGDFYSTQGPELRDVRIEDGHLVVECSAVGLDHRHRLGHGGQGGAWAFADPGGGAAGAAEQLPLGPGGGDRRGGQAGLVKPDLDRGEREEPAGGLRKMGKPQICGQLPILQGSAALALEPVRSGA